VARFYWSVYWPNLEIFAILFLLVHLVESTMVSVSAAAAAVLGKFAGMRIMDMRNLIRGSATFREMPDFSAVR
jgi:hypothetical protein